MAKNPSMIELHRVEHLGSGNVKQRGRATINPLMVTHITDPQLDGVGCSIHFTSRASLDVEEVYEHVADRIAACLAGR